jgi:hypothetical protein
MDVQCVFCKVGTEFLNLVYASNGYTERPVYGRQLPTVPKLIEIVKLQFTNEQLVEALCYKPEGRGFDTRWGHCLSSSNMALRSTQLLTEMSTRNLPGGRGRPALQADLIVICQPIFWKMWKPRRLTTPWASAACYRDSFTFFIVIHKTVAESLMICDGSITTTAASGCT